MNIAGSDGGSAMVPPQRGPALGLATTAQLLDELRARGDRLAPNGNASTGDAVGARFMAIVALHLRTTLAPVVLDYRPVDH